MKKIVYSLVLMMCVMSVFNCSSNNRPKTIIGSWETISVKGEVKEFGGEFEQDFTSQQINPIYEEMYRFKLTFDENTCVTLVSSVNGQWKEDSVDVYNYILNNGMVRILDIRNKMFGNDNDVPPLDETFEYAIIGDELFMTCYNEDEYVTYRLKRIKN